MHDVHESKALQNCRSLAQLKCLTFLLLGFCLSCASGRALTKEERTEFDALQREAAEVSGDSAKIERQVKTTVMQLSIGAKGKRARLCLAKSQTLKTGRVPLVYAKKKRIVFKPIGKNDKRGCHELSIEVKP